MIKHYLFITAFLLSTFAFSQKIIVIDDYDTAPKYSSTGDYFLSSTQYFGSTNDTDADVELGYSDITFLGARQLTSATETISYNDLDITGYTDMILVIGVAEDDATDGLEDWDSDDYVHFEYQIDNSGSWIKMLSIVASGSSDSAPQIDANLDGMGDGIDITSNFFDIEVEIPSISGTELDFRIVFGGLSEAEEDIVFEYVALVSEFDLFPEITITSPSQGQNFANGTDPVTVSYSVDGNADNIDIIINGDYGNKIIGNVNGGTVDIPTSNNQAYEILFEAFIDGYNVDDPDVYFEVGNPLSVAKDEIDGLSIYPNPVKDKRFFVSSKSNAAKSIELFDVLGKKVLNTIVIGKESINVSALTSGIYILKVQEENKLSTRKLVIK